jgi:hypothetical protein
VLTAVALGPSLALSVAMLHLANRRYRHARAALADVPSGPGGRLPFAAAAAVTLLGVAALVAVLAGGRGSAF